MLRAPFLTALAGLASLALAAPCLTTPATATPAPTPTARAAAHRAALPHVPYLVGSVLHDPDAGVRATLPEGLLYRSVAPVRGGYVVVGGRPTGDSTRVLLVRPDGDRTVLIRRQTGSTAVSPDGTRLATISQDRLRDDAKSVSVLALPSGRVLDTQKFRAPQVLAQERNRMLLTLAGENSRTVWWNWRRDSVRTVARAYALRADVDADRLLLVSGRGDPCGQRVVSLRDGDLVRRSGTLSPLAWNGTGERALTTSCYADTGYHTRVLVTAEPDGRVVSGLRTTRTGERYDGENVTWESRRRYLVVAFDDDSARILRCDLRSRCTQAGPSFPRPAAEDHGQGLVEPRIVLPRIG